MTSLRVLVDSSVAPSVTARLRADGCDVADVPEQGADPGDAAILQLAVSEDRALITLDSDFGMLVFRDGASHQGVLRLRQRTATALADRASALVAAHEEDLKAGSFVTDDGDTARVTRR
jgi:predicted nuclease of predicted toxin-antitoxin system